MEKSKQIDVIYTDFEKAFDQVNHFILLPKLEDLGMSHLYLWWLLEMS